MERKVNGKIQWCIYTEALAYWKKLDGGASDGVEGVREDRWHLDLVLKGEKDFVTVMYSETE